MGEQVPKSQDQLVGICHNLPGSQRYGREISDLSALMFSGLTQKLKEKSCNSRATSTLRIALYRLGFPLIFPIENTAALSAVRAAR